MSEIQKTPTPSTGVKSFFEKAGVQEKFQKILGEKSASFLTTVAQIAVHVAPKDQQGNILTAIREGREAMNPDDERAFQDFIRRSPRPTRQAFQLMCTPEVFHTLDKSARMELSEARARGTAPAGKYFLAEKKMRKSLIRSGIFEELFPNVWGIIEGY